MSKKMTTLEKVAFFEAQEKAEHERQEKMVSSFEECLIYPGLWECFTCGAIIGHSNRKLHFDWHGEL